MERLTVKEAAAYLGSSEYKLYQLVKQKKVPAYKIGAKILFRKEALDEWIRLQEQQYSEMQG